VKKTIEDEAILDTERQLGICIKKGTTDSLIIDAFKLLRIVLELYR
jgi:hypothetical protein